jgi:uridine kinase
MTRSAIIEVLAETIDSVRTLHPLRVAIDGVDGAGKTQLANELVAPLENIGRSVIRASIDGFHNPSHMRYKRGVNSPDGYYLDSFQNDALLDEFLIPLGPGGSRNYRSKIYDIRSETHIMKPLKEAPRDAVLLFDGIFLLRPKLINHWDYKIFVEVDFERSVERALSRDICNSGGEIEMSMLRNRYKERYVPGQKMYLKEVNPDRKADLVFENTSLENPKLIKP